MFRAIGNSMTAMESKANPGARTALALLLADNKPITDDAVKLLVKANATIEVPGLVAPDVDLAAYDTLLEVGS